MHFLINIKVQEVTKIKKSVLSLDTVIVDPHVLSVWSRDYVEWSRSDTLDLGR